MASTDHDDRFSRLVRLDDGRQFLTIAALSAGGAVIGISITGVLHAMFYRSHSPFAYDLFGAVVGFSIAFLYLLRMTHIFRRGE